MIATHTPLCLGAPRFDGGRSSPGASALSTWQALLDRHGPAQAAFQVQGDFAVAFQRADGSIFMAVDRFAVRSLCYRVDGATITFAERADHLAGHDAELDPQALFDYLYFHVIPSPSTVYSGVWRLPPGHFAVFKAGQLTVTPDWVPRVREPTRASFNDLREEFCGLLKGAEIRQLDGTRPACFLSGGTDSSTVAGMLAAATDEPVTAYSIGFETEGYDEVAFSRTAARHFGVDHRQHYVTPDDLVPDIPKVATSYDQPFGNSSALPSFPLCRSGSRRWRHPDLGRR